jgi:hypothetical protein
MALKLTFLLLLIVCLSDQKVISVSPVTSVPCLLLFPKRQKVQISMSDL